MPLESLQTDTISGIPDFDGFVDRAADHAVLFKDLQGGNWTRMALQCLEASTIL